MGKCLPSPCKTITNDSHNKIVNSSEGVEGRSDAGKKKRGEEATRKCNRPEELHICSESDRYMDGNSQYTGRLED
ncbi:hypothetical protein POVCU2_0004770 [Plasmodium ovale curtisi]|uniref:Uncharacterized protein n=1 Tax=Plasmodium ovale curtisi TaxID=864141 RepID=A0A1A8VIM5_PLAOA|nr:hypothetical protein POVCU2_0004770 [Plasmodium ovale curtisi]